MKKLATVLIIVLCASVAHAESAEVRFLMSALTPASPDDNWEGAYGLDVEMIQWLSPAVGLAGAVGFSRWSAREAAFMEYDSDSGTSLAARIDGDAAVFPVGVSVLFRPISNRSAHVTVETGFRYAMVNSDVAVHYALNESSGYDSSYDRIVLDDVLYGLIALDIVFPVSAFSKICLGAGYQFDISSSDAHIGDTYIGDNELEASLVRLGFVANF